MNRENNTEYILSLSYGKDSMACLGAIQQLGWPLDRIVTVDVWATDTIPADLPPMMEFKKKADRIIKERFGIEVEHVCAMRTVDAERELPTNQSSTNVQLMKNTGLTSTDSQKFVADGATGSSIAEKLTYESIFYSSMKASKRERERVTSSRVLRRWAEPNGVLGS